MGLKELFKKNKVKKMYYAVILADKPLDKAQLTLEDDCKMMLVYCEANKTDGVPREILQNAAESFFTPEPQGALAATNEKKESKKK